MICLLLLTYIPLYYSFNLSFNHHIDFTVGRALKVLGFIKRNIKLFRSDNCICSLYIALVRSLLEYGVVVWHPYLAKNQLRLKRVLNKFLSFNTYIIKMPPPNHDYSHIHCVLNLPSLAGHRKHIDCLFIN